MTDRTPTTTTTRRAVLAGTAALPALALALPAAAETDDPAITAVRRWVEACMAERAYHYTGDNDRQDDPNAQQLEAEFDRTSAPPLGARKRGAGGIC